MWQNWVNAILGLWILLSSFLGMSVNGMMTNLVIVGIVIAALGFWGAYDTSHQMESQRHMHA
jgi:uncharacterized membrane protein YidH (DUF202 family)